MRNANQVKGSAPESAIFVEIKPVLQSSTNNAGAVRTAMLANEDFMANAFSGEVGTEFKAAANRDNDFA